MTEHEASRTLVKSPPELWAECSDAASLGRHLEQFGELRITTLEPESAVAWEGETARGTVRLEPSGWGTRVIMTAQPASVEPGGPEDGDPPEPGDPPDPDPLPPAAGAPERVGFFTRLRQWFRGPELTGEESAPPRESARERERDPELEPEPPARVTDALTAALDSLGQAHHRPFSRA